MKRGKLKIAIDSVSVNIYIDNGEDKDPTHICYWHEDEWIEDPKLVVPAIINAVHLYYSDPDELIRRLGIVKSGKLI